MLVFFFSKKKKPLAKQGFRNMCTNTMKFRHSLEPDQQAKVQQLRLQNRSTLRRLPQDFYQHRSTGPSGFPVAVPQSPREAGPVTGKKKNNNPLPSQNMSHCRSTYFQHCHCEQIIKEPSTNYCNRYKRASLSLSNFLVCKYYQPKFSSAGNICIHRGDTNVAESNGEPVPCFVEFVKSDWI